MNIPEKIKIGCSNITIEVVDRIVEDDTEYLGDFDFGLRKIRISKNQSEDSKIETFLHEILHGILIERDVNIDSEGADLICNALSRGVIQLIQDNPGLLKKQEHRVFITLPKDMPKEVQDAIKRVTEKIHL